WIWSTFEQVDNIPPTVSDGPGTFNFHDGNLNDHMPDANPYPIDPPILPTPQPFNVERLTPIHNSTAQTNSKYRDLLKQANAVWQHYQLVMTQWPVPPDGVPLQGPVPPTRPGIPPNTIPGRANPITAFANVTMETFDQTNVKQGCMNCHN